MLLMSMVVAVFAVFNVWAMSGELAQHSTAGDRNILYKQSAALHRAVVVKLGDDLCTDLTFPCPGKCGGFPVLRYNCMVAHC
jgi:hypothetical protein